MTDPRVVWSVVQLLAILHPEAVLFAGGDGNGNGESGNGAAGAEPGVGIRVHKKVGVRVKRQVDDQPVGSGGGGEGADGDDSEPTSLEESLSMLEDMMSQVMAEMDSILVETLNNLYVQIHD